MPSTPEAPEPLPGEEPEQVILQKTPKYLNFGVIGAVLGVLASVVIALSTPSSEELTQLQALGWLMLWLVPAGVGLLLAIALIAGWAARHRAKTAYAIHTRYIVEPEPQEQPVADPTAGPDAGHSTEETS